MGTITKSRLISGLRLVGDAGLCYVAIDAFNKGAYIAGTIIGLSSVAFALEDTLEFKNDTASLSYLHRRNQHPTSI